VVTLSAGMFNQGERFNRQVTLISSYNLKLKQLIEDNDSARPISELRQEATDSAIYETQELNGGNTLETSPRYAQQGVGRAALMYKTFGISMASIQAKMAYKTARGMFGEDTPENREMGRVAGKQILAIFGSSLFFSGVYGLPIYGGVQMVYDMISTDDDEDDFDTIVEDYIGENWFRGGLNQLLDLAGVPVDVGVRVRLADLIIQENRFNPDATTEETLFYIFGGVPFSMVNKHIRGWNDMVEGEGKRALESFLPTALANPYKAFNRYKPDFGIKTRRGDFIYGELSAGELTAQVLGFPPAGYLRQQEKNRKAKGIDISINEQATSLTKKYYVAARTLDFDALEDIKTEIYEYNNKHPAAGVDMAAIARSMKSHAKTSTEMYNGISLSPKYRKIIEADLQGVYDTFNPVDDYFNR